MMTRQDFHVAYFEDDHYPSGDYVATLRAMIALQECPECISFNLGHHNIKYSSMNVTRDRDLLTYSVLNNIGLVISRA